MSCTSPRGHRWVDRIDDSAPDVREIFGDRVHVLNKLLAADPARRICRQCAARGRVDDQGKVQVVELGNPKVQVVPLARRAKWAQKRTEHDG